MMAPRRPDGPIGGAVIRNPQPRSVPASLLAAWTDAEASWENLLADVGVAEAEMTQDTVLTYLPSDEADAMRLAEQHRDVDEDWLYFGLRKTDKRMLLFPVRAGSNAGPHPDPITLYYEVHTRLTAWWLTHAWRVSELSTCAAELAERGHRIAAACCARSLLETAAQLWADSQALRDTWTEVKLRGRPRLTDEAFRSRQELIAQVNQQQMAGKFDQRVPELKAIFKSELERNNVMKVLDKLAKRVDTDLAEHYGWLCNAVHPSVGTAMTFGTRPFGHATGGHATRFFARDPLATVDASGELLEASDPIAIATAESATMALRVSTATMDAALRTVDDIALTTSAATYAPFEYWRGLTPVARNDECPCRSGKKAKRCHHAWGDATPDVPRDFRATQPAS